MKPVQTLLKPLIFCLFLFFPLVSHAENTSYLHIEGINGEVEDGAYDGYIKVFGFGHGIAIPGSFSSGAGGATGRPVINDIRVMKEIDSTTPLLIRKLLTGQHTAVVTIRFVRDGTEFLIIELSNVIITNFTPSISANGATEMITFGFAEIMWKTPNPGGGYTQFGWSVEENEEL